MNLQKIYFKSMDRLFPSILSKQVYKIMSNPRTKAPKAIEEEVLARSIKETITFKNFSIQTYQWGNPAGEIVFLIHGWEGRASNFGGLVDILLQKGYCVIGFDGPAHGNSSKGTTNMFEFSELATQLVKKYRPTTILSHSFGSVSAIVSLSKNLGVPIKNWILITTPHSFRDRIEDLQVVFGISNRTTDKVIKMVEEDTNETIDNLTIERYAKMVTNVEDILIVHSKTDRILSINSARIAHRHLTQSELIELDNLGHYSILWSDEIKQIVTKYLNPIKILDTEKIY
jgi:pimeloyl-ACP methyl ester carboxylesterase